MQIKIDEDLPNRLIELLQEQGYDAIGVIQQGMGGWKDPDLWKAVQAEQRFLITADKGFADVRAHPPGSHAGVLLLRPAKDGIRSMIELMTGVLSAYKLDDLTGAITVVNSQGIRIRRSKD